MLGSLEPVPTLAMQALTKIMSILRFRHCRKDLELQRWVNEATKALAYRRSLFVDLGKSDLGKVHSQALLPMPRLLTNSQPVRIHTRQLWAPRSQTDVTQRQAILTGSDRGYRYPCTVDDIAVDRDLEGCAAGAQQWCVADWCCI